MNMAIGLETACGHLRSLCKAIENGADFSECRAKLSQLAVWMREGKHGGVEGYEFRNLRNEIGNLLLRFPPGQPNEDFFTEVRFLYRRAAYKDCPLEAPNMTQKRFEHSVKAGTRYFERLRFSNVTFEGDFRQFAFVGCRFYECKFGNADFTGANFQSSRLTDCEFQSAQFNEVNFQHAGLYHCYLKDSDFSLVDFQRANFVRGFFAQCNLDSASFLFAKIDGTGLLPGEGKPCYIDTAQITMGGATYAEAERYREQILLALSPCSQRTNQGYTVVYSQRIHNQWELVLAHNENAVEPYATWLSCPNSSGGYDYEAGKYFSNYWSALVNFGQRIQEQAENCALVHRAPPHIPAEGQLSSIKIAVQKKAQPGPQR